MVNEIIRKNKLLDSSETLRGTSKFNFAYYSQIMPLHKRQNMDYRFLEWFIGFTEGDEPFIISSKNKTRLFFCLTKKDVRILYFIRTKLGFGRVYQDKSNKVSRFLIGDTANIKRICLLFLNNIVSSKVSQRFTFWYKKFLILYPDENLEMNDIIHKSIYAELLPSLSNAWLSGLIDAEGCFNISIISDSSYKSGFCVRLRFIIDRKEENILIAIKELFKGGFVEVRSAEQDFYRYVCSSFSCISSIISYLDKFPLHSLKRINYVKWKRVYNFLKIRFSLTVDDIEYIRKICKN
jgi:hypothetical protein